MQLLTNINAVRWAAVTMTLAAAVTFGQTPQTPPPSAERTKTPSGVTQEQTFIREVAASGHKEVEFAQMAQKKASSQDVKDFAKQLETDHQKANTKLMDLAKQKGVTLPDYPADNTMKAASTDKPGETPHKQDMSGGLASMTGKAFDSKYLDMMVANHRKSVQKFEAFVKNTKDSELRTFAEDTLPTLRSHLTKAQSLDKQLSTR